MKEETLKKLCLKMIKKNKENSKNLHEYYKKNKAKYYYDFLRTPKGKKSHNELNKIREKINKIIPLGCSDYGDNYCLDVKGILMVLEVLKC